MLTNERAKSGLFVELSYNPLNVSKVEIGYSLSFEIQYVFSDIQASELKCVKSTTFYRT